MTGTMKVDDDTLRTSWTLVARLKNVGDQEGWKDFYDVYSRLIVGVAVKAGLREDEAQDVLQETMASVVKHIPGFVTDSARGSFRAWLLNMARWRIKDQLRKRMPGAADAGRASDESSATSALERVADPQDRNLEALCDEGWKHELKTQALEKLRLEVKAEHYQLFHLLVLEEKSPAEAARLVGCSRAQVYLVRHRVARAFKKIVRSLDKTLN